MNGHYYTLPTGNGTLATITFRAQYQSVNITAPWDSCILRLFNTKLADRTGLLPGISHVVEDGSYEMPRTPIGDISWDGIVDIFELSMAALAPLAACQAILSGMQLLISMVTE